MTWEEINGTVLIVNLPQGKEQYKRQACSFQFQWELDSRQNKHAQSKNIILHWLLTVRVYQLHVYRHSVVFTIAQNHYGKHPEEHTADK